MALGGGPLCSEGSNGMQNFMVSRQPIKVTKSSELIDIRWHLSIIYEPNAVLSLPLSQSDFAFDPLSWKLK